MKKLFFLTILGCVFTACENGGGVEDENKVTPFVPEITITPTTLNFSCNGGERAVDIIANFEYEVAERASWITIEQTDEGLLVVVDENKNTTERNAFISITNSQYDVTKTIDVVQEAWVPKIDLAQQNIEVEFEPAEYEVAVTSPYSWEATTKNDWIEVKTETGIAGEEVLKFSVKRNEEMQERKGTITIKNSNYNLVVELYVIQKAFVPELTVEPESLSFAVEGGTQEIAITANFDYAYTANVDWVVLVKGENGIEVSVPNYVEVDERTAKITISSDKYGVSKIVDVTQGAFVPELIVEPESLSFAVEGGTHEITITANLEYTYTTDADWVVLNKTTNGLEVTVQNAVAFENRMAEVIISSDRYEVSKKVCISQKALSKDATNVIFYTSNNGKIVVPYKMDVFGANIMSNTYNNGMGLIFLDAPIASIGDYAFYNCRGLTSVKIPGKVTSIGDYAFEGCTNLKKVDILDLSTWCKIDFKNSAACPLYNGAELYINGEKAIKITIPSDISRIDHYAFYHCVSLEEVAISDNVTYISNSAFSQCSNLSKVTIGRGVETIYNHAFSYCNTLKSISIPANVKNLGGSLFKNCKALESATIESNIQTLPQSIFNGCSSLTDVVIPNSITEIGDYAFQNCNCLPNIIIPEEVTSIGEAAFFRCSSLTSMTIPNSVTSIESSAFYGCTGLISITIPNSITSIGNNAFYGCTGELVINNKILLETDYTSSNYPIYSSTGWLYGSMFTKLTIGNDITKIGAWVFKGCSNLTSVIIGNGVTTIGSHAFDGCFSLTSVTIGNSVTSIEYWAFGYCRNLINVYCKPIIPPTGDYTMFNGSASEKKIYVPRNSVSAYKAAKLWSNYASYIVGYDFE